MALTVYWWLSDEDGVAVDDGAVPLVGQTATISHGDPSKRIDNDEVVVVSVHHRVRNGRQIVDVKTEAV